MLTFFYATYDVSNGKLVLRVEDEEVTFVIYESMKKPIEKDDECYFVDIVDITVSGSVQEIIKDDPMELCILQGEVNKDNPVTVEQVAHLEATEFMVRKKEFEEIDRSKEARLKPSIGDQPTLELKTLPEHLEYAFLGENSKLPVIIAAELKVDQKEKLLEDRKSVV